MNHKGCKNLQNNSCNWPFNVSYRVSGRVHAVHVLLAVSLCLHFEPVRRIVVNIYIDTVSNSGYSE